MSSGEQQPFDFSFPAQAYGYSSGWSEIRNPDFNKEPDLSCRRRVALIKAGQSIFFPIESLANDLDCSGTRDDGQIPFFIKVPRDLQSGGKKIAALSSGAGSALFLHKGRVCKLKRCGVSCLGFPQKKCRAHGTFIAEDDEEYEFSGEPIQGLMSLASAFHESRMLAKLRLLGYCNAYKPIGMLVISQLNSNCPAGIRMPPEGIFAAVVSEITSDLRIDELVWMALTPLLHNLFTAELMSYDAAYSNWEFFDAKGIPTRKVFENWSFLSDQVKEIGLSVGAAYKRLHNSGFLRGQGSCWFGNEIVDPAGEISFVDLDGGFLDYSDIKHSAYLRHQQLIEIEEYCSQTYLMLSSCRPKILKMFAASFIRAFREGYTIDYRPLTSSLLSEIIQNHLARWDSLQTFLGFKAESFSS